MTDMTGKEALEELVAQVAFTLTDAARLLRKEDVHGACPHPDDCFYESGRVRCGPCAVKASAAKGVEIDDTHSHLPEVCRLRREVKALEARAIAAETKATEMEEAKNAILQVIKHHSGSDHGVMGVRMLVERAVAAEERVKRLESGSKREPDYCYDPHEWEFTCSWDERDLVHGHGESLDFGSSIMEVATFFKGPTKYVARVPISFDDYGDADDYDIRWFDTEEEARAALVGDKP